MGQSLQRVLLDYKQMLNSKNEKELFCVVLTHCDANVEFEGEPAILDAIVDNDCQKLETFDERQTAHRIYEDQFAPDIETYSRVFTEQLGLEYKLFKPTSCISQTKIAKRDLRDFPFLPELQTIVLDNFADTLIDILQSNAKYGGLNTEQLKMILKQDTIKDLMLLYDAAELSICSKVMSQL